MYDFDTKGLQEALQDRLEKELKRQEEEAQKRNRKAPVRVSEFRIGFQGLG